MNSGRCVKKAKMSSKVNPFKKKKAKTSRRSVSDHHEEQYTDEQNEEVESDFDKQKYLYLVRGMDSNSQLRVWHYLIINENKHAAFLSKVKGRRSMNVSEYGEVLYSGWGNDPPLDVVRSVSIELELPFFKSGLRKLGFNCTAIKKIDNVER